VDDREKLPLFLEKFPLNYPVLTGEILEVLSVQDAFGDSRLPFSVILDRSGNIVFRKAGELERPELDEILKPLL
jgi:hypothetical protein